MSFGVVSLSISDVFLGTPYSSLKVVMSSASGDNQNVDYVNAIFGSDLPLPEHSFKETPAIVEEGSASSSSSKGGVVSFASPSTPRTFFVTRKEMVHGLSEIKNEVVYQKHEVEVFLDPEVLKRLRYETRDELRSKEIP